MAENQIKLNISYRYFSEATRNYFPLKFIPAKTLFNTRVIETNFYFLSLNYDCLEGTGDWMYVSSGYIRVETLRKYRMPGWLKFPCFFLAAGDPLSPASRRRCETLKLIAQVKAREQVLIKEFLCRHNSNLLLEGFGSDVIIGSHWNLLRSKRLHHF